MNLTWEVVGVLLVLSPGILTSRIISGLFVTKPSDTVDRVSGIFVWASLDYAILLVVGHWKNSLLTDTLRWGHAAKTAVVLPIAVVPTAPWGVVALFIIAACVGVLVAASCTRGYHMHIMRKLGVTLRTTHCSIWGDAIHQYRGCPVLVQTANGSSLWGKLRYCSDTPDEASLVLEHPRLVGRDGSYTQSQIAKAVLLTRESGVTSVMFYNIKDADPVAGKRKRRLWQRT